MGYNMRGYKGEKLCNAMSNKIGCFFSNVKCFCKEKKRGEKG